MAITAQSGNVYVLANGDTFVGRVHIKSANLVGASSTANLTDQNSVKCLDVAGPLYLPHLDLKIPAGYTITANLTGSGARLYLYLE